MDKVSGPQALSMNNPGIHAMKKLMNERSPNTVVQHGRPMRFSDPSCVDEVGRLLVATRLAPFAEHIEVGTSRDSLPDTSVSLFSSNVTVDQSRS